MYYMVETRCLNLYIFPLLNILICRGLGRVAVDNTSDALAIITARAASRLAGTGFPKWVRNEEEVVG